MDAPLSTALLALPRRPSAIFVTNNVMTVGALVAIAEAGLEVPRDISIVGIDDMEWFPIAKPAITAVYEPAAQMGRRAAERLLLRLRRQRQPRTEHIRVETEFRVRQSVGPRGGPPGWLPAGVTTARRSSRASDEDAGQDRRCP